MMWQELQGLRQKVNTQGRVDNRVQVSLEIRDVLGLADQRLLYPTAAAVRARLGVPTRT